MNDPQDDGIFQRLMRWLFGSSWRTSISGMGAALTTGLTLLAGAPYALGDAATVIPPEWKARIFMWAGGATVLLQLIHARSAKDTSDK